MKFPAALALTSNFENLLTFTRSCEEQELVTYTRVKALVTRIVFDVRTSIHKALSACSTVYDILDLIFPFLTIN